MAATGLTDSAAAAAASSSLPEEVQASYDYMPAALAGYAAGVGVVGVLFWASTATPVMLAWLAGFALMLGVRLIATRRFARARPQTSADWLGWRRQMNLGTLAAGALWGVTGWIFYARGNDIQQIGLIVIVYTFCTAALPVLAIQPRMYLAFAALCMGPLIVRIASGADVYSYQLAGELLLIITITTVLARTYRQSLQRAIELKLQADGLLSQLRVEKQAADAARAQAEIANRAKTQFFAAASHDLRQPLHAMGLFAEALRQRANDPEVTQLVGSINESVDALEGLFSELLDITRIDAGGVDVNPVPFEFGELLRKLRLHFEPTAFEKGLALRLRGGARVIHADPLLVERILRNLVANAIRYTDDGSVLVACRPLGGDRVRVQVWDSGRGIAEDQRSRIFEEFYQVPETTTRAAGERKGLGLGLATVQRLARLMNAPLTLRSVPGRGSVFTLELPAGRLPRTRPSPPPGKGPLALTLEGRLIVVVEDEPAVRAGLEVLLRGWGAELAGFDSAGAAQAWAGSADSNAARPDLLIVDYRLEGGRNGIDVITALRRRFGADVPAIVVTGSTMSGLEKEAHDNDFHLLVKPVLPGKLRAMIAFKLAVRAAAREPQ
jgi:signal transduction histidine kinase/CheY-like chemotaxis protein